MNLEDFASHTAQNENDTAQDALFIRLGAQVVRVPLHREVNGPPEPGEVEGISFGDAARAREFVQLVCGLVVAGLMSDEDRARIQEAAAALHG